MTAYDTAVLADSPVVYLKLNETAGTTASDSSGHAHHFTYASGVTLNAGDGLLGHMVKGSGSNFIASLLSMPDPFTASVGGSFAIECWATLPDSSRAGPFAQVGSGATGYGMGVGAYYDYSVAGDNVVGNLGSYGFLTDFGGGAGLLGTGEHQIVMELDLTSGYWHFYVDGVLRFTQTGTAVDATTRVDVGGNFDTSVFLDAGVKLGHVSLYNHALGATAVAAHYTAALGTTAAVALVATSTLLAHTHAFDLNARTGTITIGAGAGVEWTGYRQPSINAVDPIPVQTTFMGSAKVIPGPVTIPAGLDLRLVAGVTITPDVPAIVLGKPIVPDFWAKTDSTMTATGSGGLLMIPDPDPIVTPPVGGTNPHPGGLAPTYTWHVQDLSLGAVSSWAPHGGSGPTWVSAGGFRPILRQTILYGAEDRYHTYTKGLHFDGADVQHMTLDWGSNLAQPFTVIICSIIHYYPERTYGHYLFDSGKPVSTGLADGRDHRINEGLTYRSVMLYQMNNAILATHTGADAVANGKHVITRADFAPRPKMFFAIFNGSSSYIGAWDNRNKYIKRGTIDNKSPRYFVTGRRQNNVSDNLASHQTMFEMRMFNSAVSMTVLNEIYKQLAATWKFNQYHV